MKVAMAARNPDKEVLKRLEQEQGVTIVACDASNAESVTELFETVKANLGNPKLVVHNIDGRSRDIFRKSITEADPELVLDTIRNSTFSAFLTGQQAARHMLENPLDGTGHRGTINPAAVTGRR